MTKEQKAFVLRLADRLPVSLKENVVGVGWADAQELDKIHDWELFKKVVRTAHPHLYDGNERGLGNASGSIWRFIHDMKIGDLVAVPVPDGFYIAQIQSDVFYDAPHQKDDYAWRRKVTWLTKAPIPRSYAMKPLQLRLKSRQTCVDASDLVQEIEAAKQRKDPVEITSFILSSAHDAVANALVNAINDYGLEKVVRQLVLASGATTAEIPAKNSGKPGDADVIATYDLKVNPQHTAQVKIIYQVKQHEGVTDEWGIQQLLDRMKMPDENIICGCLVTTATTISTKAQQLVDEHEEIMVVTQKELVEWVLKTGLTALSDTGAVAAMNAA